MYLKQERGLAASHHSSILQKVWIERTDAERARPILAEYEQRTSERRVADRRNDLAASEPILVTCDECGTQSEFPAAQKGSVQNCPKCYAYVDVGEDIEFEGWDEIPEQQE